MRLPTKAAVISMLDQGRINLQTHPHWPPYRAHNMTDGFLSWRVLRGSKWEEVTRQKPQSFYNLHLDMTSHHFCSILFIFYSLEMSYQVQWGEVIKQGTDTRRQRSLGIILQAACQKMINTKWCTVWNDYTR